MSDVWVKLGKNLTVIWKFWYINNQFFFSGAPILTVVAASLAFAPSAPVEPFAMRVSLHFSPSSQIPIATFSHTSPFPARNPAMPLPSRQAVAPIAPAVSSERRRSYTLQVLWCRLHRTECMRYAVVTIASPARNEEVRRLQ